MIQLLSLLLLLSDELPKDAKPLSPPVISAELRAKFWRAQLESDRAQRALASTVEEMTKACGTVSVLQAGPDGEPACVIKPPEPKKP